MLKFLHNGLQFWALITVLDLIMVGIAINSGMIAGAVIATACTVLSAKLTWDGYKKGKASGG